MTTTSTTKSSDEELREQSGLSQGGSYDVAVCWNALGTCNVVAGGPPAAEGTPRAASTACVEGHVAVGRPPAAEGRPRAAGTACNACAGTPPAAVGTPHAASTTCGSVMLAGRPHAAEGKSPATSTACARVVTVSRSA